MNNHLKAFAFLLPIFFFTTVANATSLYIRSNTDQTAISALLAGFEKKYPDVDIIYHDHNSNELAELILENSNDPEFETDIVISSSMDLQVKLVNEGLAHQFTPTVNFNLPEWAQWRNELYGFTYEPVVAVYHKPSFSDRDIPTDREVLIASIRQNPDFYVNRVGVYDIKESGVGYMFATQDSIHSNQIFTLNESLGWANVQTYCCTSDILNRVAEGELVYGYNVLGSYALQFAKSNPDLGVILMSDYTLAMARSAFIPKSSKQKELAETFIQFILSYEGQSIMARETALIPINTSIVSRLTPYLGQFSILPIKLDVGLLAFLDQMKRRIFLENWERSINRY
ncbi:ABC transporter substrate-binding protein [Curvivirga sp.]|uniref:ABC transporter substrate-binding protein n=1 Tax=Curvivirga sp. TaxID=2856848 RepID=UPI003B5B1142